MPDSATDTWPQLDPAAAERLLHSATAGAQSADPYPAYHQLRAQAPVLRMRGDMLALTRFDDCEAAFRHRGLGRPDDPMAGWVLGRPLDEDTRHALSWLTRTMMMSNPPDHTRLRRLLASAFTPKFIAGLQDGTIAVVDELLDRLATRRGVDFVAEVGRPLPLRIIADLLGIPRAETDRCVPLCVQLSHPLTSPAAIDAAVEAQAELRTYFLDLFARKRREPGTDVLSRLVSSCDADKLTDDEVMGTAVLLFTAGFESTSNLLGNGLRALLAHPDQMERLREHPELIGPAVEEMLRYDSPIQQDWQIVLEPTTVAGVDVVPGQAVMLMVGAANRDPARFPDPDRFNLTRDQGSHLAFGAGIHFCLGAQLVRLEARVLFTRMLRRFRHIEPAGPSPVEIIGNLRGTASLPVTLG